MLHQDWQKMSMQIKRAIAQAWLDSEFEAQFKKDPKSVLHQFTNGKVFFPENVTVEIDTMTFSWRAGTAPGNPEQAVITIPFPPKPADVTAEELARWTKEDNQEMPRYLSSCC
jgi:hypothetical protein